MPRLYEFTLFCPPVLSYIFVSERYNDDKVATLHSLTPLPLLELASNGVILACRAFRAYKFHLAPPAIAGAGDSVQRGPSPKLSSFVEARYSHERYTAA